MRRLRLHTMNCAGSTPLLDGSCLTQDLDVSKNIQHAGPARIGTASSRSAVVPKHLLVHLHVERLRFFGSATGKGTLSAMVGNA